MWGKATIPATVTRAVTTLAAPVDNAAPSAVMSNPVCTGRSCVVNSAGSADADGGIRNYTFKWGDGTADTVTTSTSNQTHVYAAAGTFTITLVATDNWGRTTTVTRTVTVT